VSHGRFRGLISSRKSFVFSDGVTRGFRKGARIGHAMPETAGSAGNGAEDGRVRSGNASLRWMGAWILGHWAGAAGWLDLGAELARVVIRSGGAASLLGAGGVVEAGAGAWHPRHTLTRWGPRGQAASRISFD
jgi:hypothetical protein